MPSSGRGRGVPQVRRARSWGDGAWCCRVHLDGHVFDPLRGRKGNSGDLCLAQGTRLPLARHPANPTIEPRPRGHMLERRMNSSLGYAGHAAHWTRTAPETHAPASTQSPPDTGDWHRAAASGKISSHCRHTHAQGGAKTSVVSPDRDDTPTPPSNFPTLSGEFRPQRTA